MHSFSTGLKQWILASAVVLAVGVENKHQTLSCLKQIRQFLVKNAVLAVDFKQQTHQQF